MERRSVKLLMANVSATLAGMVKSPKFTQNDVDVFRSRSARRVAKFMGLGNKTFKPNGAKECARRRRQMAQGRIFNYDRENHYGL